MRLQKEEKPERDGSAPRISLGTRPHLDPQTCVRTTRLLRNAVSKWCAKHSRPPRSNSSRQACSKRCGPDFQVFFLTSARCVAANRFFPSRIQAHQFSTGSLGFCATPCTRKAQRRAIRIGRAFVRPPLRAVWTRMLIPSHARPAWSEGIRDLTQPTQSERPRDRSQYDS